MDSFSHIENEGKDRCCEICFECNKEQLSSNLMQCSSCGFTVHKECYYDNCDSEEEEFINNELWLCDRCKYEKNSGNIPLECQICHTNLKDIGMKYYKYYNSYYHIFCLYSYYNKYIIQNEKNKELPSITNENECIMNEKCKCKEKKQISTITCNNTNCTCSFHPICILYNKNYQILAKMEENQLIKYEIYCEKHHHLESDILNKNINGILIGRKNNILMNENRIEIPPLVKLETTIITTDMNKMEMKEKEEKENANDQNQLPLPPQLDLQSVADNNTTTITTDSTDITSTTNTTSVISPEKTNLANFSKYVSLESLLKGKRGRPRKYGLPPMSIIPNNNLKSVEGALISGSYELFYKDECQKCPLNDESKRSEYEIRIQNMWINLPQDVKDEYEKRFINNVIFKSKHNGNSPANHNNSNYSSSPYNSSYNGGNMKSNSSDNFKIFSNSSLASANNGSNSGNNINSRRSSKIDNKHRFSFGNNNNNTNNNLNIRNNNFIKSHSSTLFSSTNSPLLSSNHRNTRSSTINSNNNNNNNIMNDNEEPVHKINLRSHSLPMNNNSNNFCDSNTLITPKSSGNSYLHFSFPVSNTDFNQQVIDPYYTEVDNSLLELEENNETYFQVPPLGDGLNMLNFQTNQSPIHLNLPQTSSNLNNNTSRQLLLSPTSPTSSSLFTSISPSSITSSSSSSHSSQKYKKLIGRVTRSPKLGIPKLHKLILRQVKNNIINSLTQQQQQQYSPPSLQNSTSSTSTQSLLQDGNNSSSSTINLNVTNTAPNTIQRMDFGDNEIPSLQEQINAKYPKLIVPETSRITVLFRGLRKVKCVYDFNHCIEPELHLLSPSSIPTHILLNQQQMQQQIQQQQQYLLPPFQKSKSHISKQQQQQLFVQYQQTQNILLQQQLQQQPANLPLVSNANYKIPSLPVFKLRKGMDWIPIDFLMKTSIDEISSQMKLEYNRSNNSNSSFIHSLLIDNYTPNKIDINKEFLIKVDKYPTWVKLTDYQIVDDVIDNDDYEDEILKELEKHQQKLHEVHSHNIETCKELSKRIPSKDYYTEKENEKERIEELENNFIQYYYYKIIFESLINGSKDKVRHVEDPITEWTIKANNRPYPIENNNPYDTCSICFSHVIEDWNPIITCTGCQVQFHKVCYGLTDVNGLYNSDFYCDVCSDIYCLSSSNNSSSRRNSYSNNNNNNNSISPSPSNLFPYQNYPKCMLCDYSGGALRKIDDNKFVHLACCLWLPGIIINDFVKMIDITISEDLYKYVNIPVVQMNNDNKKEEEYELKIKYTNITDFPIVDVNNKEINNNKLKIKNIPILKISNNQCIYCKSNHGITIKCSDPNCKEYFHLFCAYYNGNYMRVIQNDNLSENGSYCYCGGGCGNIYEIYCIDHTPIDKKEDENKEEKGSDEFKLTIPDISPKKKRQNEQIELRKPTTNHPLHFLEFLNEIYIYTNVGSYNLNYYTPVTQPNISTTTTTTTTSSKNRIRDINISYSPNSTSESSSIVNSPKTDNNKVKFVLLTPDIYPDNTCMSCLTKQPIDSLIECQICHVKTHPACYGLSSSIINKDKSNWLCDVCYDKNKDIRFLLQDQNNNNDDKELSNTLNTATTTTTVYADPNDPNDVPRYGCCLCPHSNGILKRTNDGLYIHMYCAMVHKHVQFVFASNGELIVDTHLLQHKWRNKYSCEICNQRCGKTMECNTEGCNRHFHPLCAYFNKIPLVYECGNGGNNDEDHDIYEYKNIISRNNVLYNAYGKIIPKLYCLHHIPDTVKFIPYRKCFIKVRPKRIYQDLLKKCRCLERKAEVENEEKKGGNEGYLSLDSIDKIEKDYRNIIQKKRMSIAEKLKDIQKNAENVSKQYHRFITRRDVRITIPESINPNQFNSKSTTREIDEKELIERKRIRDERRMKRKIVKRRKREDMINSKSKPIMRIKRSGNNIYNSGEIDNNDENYDFYDYFCIYESENGLDFDNRNIHYRYEEEEEDDDNSYNNSDDSELDYLYYKELEESRNNRRIKEMNRIRERGNINSDYNDVNNDDNDDDDDDNIVIVPKGTIDMNTRQDIPMSLPEPPPFIQSKSSTKKKSKKSVSSYDSGNYSYSSHKRNRKQSASGVEVESTQCSMNLRHNSVFNYNTTIIDDNYKPISKILSSSPNQPIPKEIDNSYLDFDVSDEDDLTKKNKRKTPKRPNNSSKKTKYN